MAITYIPYFLGLWRFKKLGGEFSASKYAARSWLATALPATFVLYILIVDGLTFIELDFVKMIVTWAIAQGIIFTIKSTAEKIFIKKGDLQVGIDFSKKNKTADASKGTKRKRGERGKERK
ncbi:MAG: hypothetical protein FWF72_06805 [Paludibacter sp.]|nr:hypothetical protein [Paludibacter sp.]